jgi:phospholipid transport system substrate-binding protein
MAGIFKHIITIACLLLVGFSQTRAIAGAPKEQIQETIQQALHIVNGAVGANDTASRDHLRDALMPRFDWAEMAKRTLGKHWDENLSRQEEFIAAFADFLGNVYAGKIGLLRDETILFGNESIVDNDAQVNTKIVPAKGEPMTVNYRLHRVQGEWKIYDVVLDDISLVVNYRSQFSRILTKGGFDELLRQLRDKESKVRN